MNLNFSLRTATVALIDYASSVCILLCKDVLVQQNYVHVNPQTGHSYASQDPEARYRQRRQSSTDMPGRAAGLNRADATPTSFNGPRRNLRATRLKYARLLDRNDSPVINWSSSQTILESCRTPRAKCSSTMSSIAKPALFAGRW